jgi:hypothetical protein
MSIKRWFEMATRCVYAIERLVESGKLAMQQVTPRAPWEIRRSDLNAEVVAGPSSPTRLGGLQWWIGLEP